MSNYNPTKTVTATPKTKKSKAWIGWSVGILVALFMGIGIGSGGSSTTSATPVPTKTVTATPKAAKPAPTVTTTVTVPAPEPVQETTEAASSFEGDGTFEVGVDIQPGTYKSGPDDELCYWARLKNTSGDFDAIITNHNGANATVTIKKTDGAFETARCGTWTKVK